MEKLTPEQQQLVLDNFNLPHFVMHKKFPSYYPGSYEYEDLSQEGYLALCIAATRYDDEISTFCTFAFNYIWGYIIQYINRKSGWAFHLRKENGNYDHIPYGSLNIFVCEGNREDSSKELFEIIPNRKNDYDATETWMDLLPVFQKANTRYGEKILRLSALGYGQQQIGAILGISQMYVSRTVTKATNIYYAVQNYDPKYPDQLVWEMLDKGYSNQLIADVLNVDITYVKRVKRERRLLR